MSDLNRLIAEASVLAGGKHPCGVLGHLWKSKGGRQCPYARYHQSEPGCSQAVYECTACGDTDYGEPGEPGGPGYRDCVIDGPCSMECEEEKEAAG